MPISRPKIDLPREAANQTFWARLASGWLIPFAVLFGLLLAGGILWNQIHITAIKAEQIYSLLICTLVFLFIGKALVGLIRWLRRHSTANRSAPQPAPSHETDHGQPD